MGLFLLVGKKVFPAAAMNFVYKADTSLQKLTDTLLNVSWGRAGGEFERRREEGEERSRLAARLRKTDSLRRHRRLQVGFFRQ